MKTNRKFTVLRLLALGVLVAGFNVKPASAQVFKGYVTFASATQWGQATLPSGTYSFTLDRDYPGSRVTIFRGKQTVTQVLVPVVDSIKKGRSEIIVNDGVVRQVSLPQIGLSLQYPAPNSGHRAAPQGQIFAQITPVAVAGSGR